MGLKYQNRLGDKTKSALNTDYLNSTIRTAGEMSDLLMSSEACIRAIAKYIKLASRKRCSREYAAEKNTPDSMIL